MRQLCSEVSTWYWMVLGQVVLPFYGCHLPQNGLRQEKEVAP